METPQNTEMSQGMAQLRLSAFGRDLCLSSILWDVTTTGGKRTYGVLFHAINGDDVLSAMREALAHIEAAFTFQGYHEKAIQCLRYSRSINMLWDSYGQFDMFDSYIQSGRNTEGRRRPAINQAMGLDIITGKQATPHPPMWQLRTDPEGRSYDLPVYRMLSSKEYLHDFWNHGKLRISTLTACKRHEGLQGDRSEGDYALWSVRPDGTTIMTGYEVGGDAYILCSTVANSEGNRKTFRAERSGAIMITDPYRFGLAIGAAIPHVTHGQAGYCDYRDTRILHLKDDTEGAAIHASIDFESGIGLEKFRSITPGEEVFVKEKEPFTEQEEFRFAWYTPKPIIGDFVEIVCPEAIGYCRPVWFE